jgi:hypothetical protein
MAAVVLDTGYKALLWVVRDVRSEKGEAMANLPVCAAHVNTMSACLFKRLNYPSHTIVEQVCQYLGAIRLFEAVQFGNGEVSNQNTSVRILPVANILRDIAQSHVYRPCLLATPKAGEASFVRRKKESKRGSPRPETSLT